MTSKTKLQETGLIDLLYERHHDVQKMAQKAWDEENDIYISDSGWAIMATIYDGRQPISHITKNIDITRQAIHKFIKSLSEKGLIEISEMPNDKKKKCVELTALGRRYYKRRMTIKSSIEEEITRKLGR